MFFSSSIRPFFIRSFYVARRRKKCLRWRSAKPSYSFSDLIWEPPAFFISESLWQSKTKGDLWICNFCCDRLCALKWYLLASTTDRSMSVESQWALSILPPLNLVFKGFGADAAATLAEIFGLRCTGLASPLVISDSYNSSLSSPSAVPGDTISSNWSRPASFPFGSSCGSWIVSAVAFLLCYAAFSAAILF